MSYRTIFEVPSSWSTGFIGSFSIQNTGATPQTGWTVEFDAPFEITNLWNGAIVSKVGSHYVIRNASWNATIPPGGTVTFGFQASSSGTVVPPTGVTVNGEVPGQASPALPSLAVGDVTLNEGDAGTTDAVFTVALSAPSSRPVTVAYATEAGTATAGSDFTGVAGTLSFAPGESVKTVRVPVRGDTAVEAEETFRLNLSQPTNAVIADSQATAQIVNDDVPVPALAVSDVSLAEGNSGTKLATFTVSLSQGTTVPVSVAYSTADVTATAGSDYVATSGSLTFAPGETSRTVSVAVTGDLAVEANESFVLQLSNPQRATIADGQGAAVIVNDDAAPALTISVADTSLVEGDPGGLGGGRTFLSTAGNQIVDAGGQPVRIAGVNWFGLESGRYAPDGLFTRNYQSMMDQMVELGFNTVRLPFSNEALDPGRRPNDINFALNPDLAGLTSLEVLDKIVAYAGEVGLRIILDHHRSSAGAGASENGLWYNAQYSEARWISDWTALAARYAGNPTVIGADLHNEPHGPARWGGGGAQDWPAAAERAGNAIHDVNPDWLIFVEGVESYNGVFYWWGGNLMGVKDRPVALELPGKLVYSPHDYPNSVYPQPFFYQADFPNNLPDKFEQMWGYIFEQEIAPVYLGEFGSRLTDPKDRAWFEKIMPYINGDFDANGVRDLAANHEGISWTWWSWNPNSGDTGGILSDDWRSVQTQKVEGLRPAMFEFEDAQSSPDGDLREASFAVSLSAPSTEAVSVDYATQADTATTADYVPESGRVTFQPGETTKTITVSVREDDLPEPDERFALVLSNASGASLVDGTAYAIIDDDDGFSFPPPPPPPPPPPSPGDDALDPRVTIANDWGAGFVANVSVRNGGATLVDDWTLELEMPYTIVNIWNAEIVSRSGNDYVIRNASWNDKIAPGEEVSFGFQATPGSVNPLSFDFG